MNFVLHLCQFKSTFDELIKNSWAFTSIHIYICMYKSTYFKGASNKGTPGFVNSGKEINFLIIMKQKR